MKRSNFWISVLVVRYDILVYSHITHVRLLKYHLHHSYSCSLCKTSGYMTVETLTVETAAVPSTEPHQSSVGEDDTDDEEEKEPLDGFVDDEAANRLAYVPPEGVVRSIAIDMRPKKPSTNLPKCVVNSN